MLVSVNPREKTSIYNDEVKLYFNNTLKRILLNFYILNLYFKTKKIYHETNERSALDPHIFWTCSEAYKNALATQKV